MKRYLPFAIVAGVFFIAAGPGTSFFFWKQRTAQIKTASTEESPVRLGRKPGIEPAHIRGSPNARVQIEEFGDFQCPSCAALSPALNQAEQKYHGKLCVVFRHFPLRLTAMRSQRRAPPRPPVYKVVSGKCTTYFTAGN